MSVSSGVYTFKKANNNGVDRSVPMFRLLCIFVVSMQQRVISYQGPYYYPFVMKKPLTDILPVLEITHNAASNQCVLFARFKPKNIVFTLSLTNQGLLANLHRTSPTVAEISHMMEGMK